MAKKKALHEKLGIRFAELGALYGVRAMLIAKDLIPKKTIEVCSNTHSFNMSTAGEVKECGSVGCIGGNMAIIMGITSFGDVAAYVHNHQYLRKYLPTECCSEALTSLFFPDANTRGSESAQIPIEWSDFTVKQTLQAIDNFLAGKKRPWAGIAYKPHR
jgi:hypothetical protein